MTAGHPDSAGAAGTKDSRTLGNAGATAPRQKGEWRQHHPPILDAYEEVRVRVCAAAGNVTEEAWGLVSDGHLQGGGVGAVGVDEVVLHGGTGDGQPVTVQPAEQVLAGADDSHRGRDDGPYDAAGLQREPAVGAIGGHGGGEPARRRAVEPGQQRGRRCRAEAGQLGGCATRSWRTLRWRGPTVACCGRIDSAW